MPFQVIYSAEAESELIKLWMRSPAKEDFNQAVHRIDRLLSADPRKHGSEISEELYAIKVPPLKALFEIHDQDVTVEVTGIAFLPS